MAPEDGGAESWSPRLALWHALSGERIRVAYLGDLLATRPGQPVDMMAFAASESGPASIAGLRAEFHGTVTPQDMLAVLEKSRADANRLVTDLAEEDLDRAATLTEFVHDYLRAHGQHPSGDVRGVLLHGAVHLRDHARQVASAERTPD